MIFTIKVKLSILAVTAGRNKSPTQVFRPYMGVKACFPALFTFFYLCLTAGICVAQSIDSLMVTIRKMKEKPGFEQDTSYLNTANELGYYLAETNPDSAILFLDKQLVLCRNASFRKGEAEVLKIYGNAFQAKGDFKGSLGYYNRALSIAKNAKAGKMIPGILNNIGLVYFNLGNYSQALSTYFEAVKGAEKENNNFVKAAVLNNIAYVYLELENMDEAEKNYLKVLEIDSASGDLRRMVQSLNNIGDVRLIQKRPAEALVTMQRAYGMAIGIASPDLIEMSSRTLAAIYVSLDSTDKAERLFRESISLSKQNNYGVPLVKSMIGLSKIMYQKGTLKEALGFAMKAKELSEEMGQTILMRNANDVLSKIYEAEGNTAASLESYKLFKQYNDSINDLRSRRVAATLEAEYEFSKKALQFEKESLRQQWIIISALAGLLSIVVILVIIARNRNKLNQAYHKLQENNIVIENKNRRLEETLYQLTEAQAQLIQSEKMASLGELTAGIAHEIQNPLNFVNNFAEVSNELIEEMKVEFKKGELDEGFAIADDIKQNLEKINHHGKRADAIVKGMLQHSRTSSGQKEPTDLNALCDEYLRLSWHGLKAKDPSFNASFHFEPDESLPKLNVVPQDIGRVLLNLINNAFQACAERSRIAVNGYREKPMVKVSTHKRNNFIEIMVADNGPGIPEAIRDKIFQPFFTTKPTGEGTGLGLSLSYDIISKGHNGSLEMQTSEGVGSIFRILLPFSSSNKI
jgi:signal transduction histidine kinase/tetratricopeptide (TPR) repeat protein